MAESPAPAWRTHHFWYLIPALTGSVVWWYSLAQGLLGRLGFEQADILVILLFLIMALFGLGLWLGSAMLTGYLVKSRLVWAGEALLTSAPVLFFIPLGPWSILAAIVTWAAVYMSIERTAREGLNQIKVRYRQTISRVAPWALILILLAASLNYYQVLVRSNQLPEQLAKRLVDQSITVIEKFLPQFYRQYKPEITVDEFLGLQVPDAQSVLNEIDLSALPDKVAQETAVRDALQRRGIEVDSINLPSNEPAAEVEAHLREQLAGVRDDAIAQYREELSKQFGVQLDGKTTMHEALATVLDRQYEERVKPYAHIVPPILALGLFFILRIFSILFLLGIEWVGAGWYWLLRKLHVITVSESPATIERLNWHA